MSFFGSIIRTVTGLMVQLISGLVSLFRAAPRTPSRANRKIVVVLALLAIGGAIFFMVN